MIWGIDWRRRRRSSGVFMAMLVEFLAGTEALPHTLKNLHSYLFGVEAQAEGKSTKNNNNDRITKTK